VGVTQLNNSFHLTYEVCDDTQLDNDDTNGVATFDFGDATAQIRAELPSGQNLNVSYYESESDALSEQNAISDITNHRNENAPHTQNIYVRVESEDLNACMGLGHHITLNVKPLPVKQLIPNYILCGTENTASFDLSTVTPDVIGAQIEPLYVSYHLSKQDAIDNNPITTPEAFSNTTNPQTIFVRVHYDQNNNQQLDQGECLRTDLNFNLEVEAPPVLKTPDLLVKCSDAFEAEFDLTEREGQITDGDETLVVSYYKSAMDLQNNNPILNPTQYLSEQQFKTILVQAEWPSKCTSIVELELEVLLYAQLNNNPDPIEDCESDNDGLDIFDLTLRETQIVNNLDLSMFEFSYYELENEANLGTANSIPDPTSFINTTPFNQTIFIRIKQLGSPCFQIIALDIIVNQGPETALEDRYLICFDADYQLVTPSGETLLSSPPMDTGLDPNIYDFQWYAGTQEEVINDPELFVLDGETNPSLTTIQEGVYTVVVTNQLTGCEMSISTLLIKSSPPDEITAKILHPPFTFPNAVEVLVTGAGNYQYALEDGPWQEENIFANLGYGEHRISVRDRLGCAVEDMTINIIDYPKYFTPNGDGYHDSWNISSLRLETTAKIYIFDRYGKLLKELRPTGDGWDGTFNGSPMPSDDYWFLVEFFGNDSDELNRFKPHFTLKR
jgi:gliding motility-associated-like protein